MYRFERPLLALRGLDVQKLDPEELLQTRGW
jgi:hypothetical protein